MSEESSLELYRFVLPRSVIGFVNLAFVFFFGEINQEQSWLNCINFLGLSSGYMCLLQVLMGSGSSASFMWLARLITLVWAQIECFSKSFINYLILNRTRGLYLKIPDWEMESLLYGSRFWAGSINQKFQPKVCNFTVKPEQTKVIKLFIIWLLDFLPYYRMLRCRNVASYPFLRQQVDFRHTVPSLQRMRCICFWPTHLQLVHTNP